jgi:hypothetical protein
MLGVASRELWPSWPARNSSADLDCSFSGFPAEQAQAEEPRAEQQHRSGFGDLGKGDIIPITVGGVVAVERRCAVPQQCAPSAGSTRAGIHGDACERENISPELSARAERCGTADQPNNVAVLAVHPKGSGLARPREGASDLKNEE